MKSKISDKILVEQLSSKSEKAFRCLFDKYHQDIFIFSKSILKLDSLAEEIVQEVFLKVWLNASELNPDLEFKSYIFTIARNLSLNSLRSAVNNRKLTEEIFYLNPGIGKSSDEILLDEELENIRIKAIESLPTKRREIFILSRTEGKSYNEISSELGISINTVKVQMSKALETLRKYIQIHGDLTLLILIFFFYF